MHPSRQRSTPTWRFLPLGLSNLEPPPPLMISTCFEHSSYVIHMTDMVNLWSEKLGRKEIIMRGFTEDTSIDPSEGDNMNALLDKLSNAFDSSSPDHSNVKLSLRASSYEINQGQDLELTVTYTFHSRFGLKPLVWPIYLKKQLPIATANELVIPLLRVHQNKTQEIEGLVQELENKDALLNRLVNRLENMNIGLEKIFNVLPQKKKATREEAENRIRGLAPFQLDSWLEHLHGQQKQSPQPSDVNTLIQQVFGHHGVPYERDSTDRGTRSDISDWLNEFGTISSDFATEASVTGTTTTAKVADRPSTSNSPELTDDEAEFEIHKSALAQPLQMSQPTKTAQINTVSQITSSRPAGSSSSLGLAVNDDSNFSNQDGRVEGKSYHRERRSDMIGSMTTAKLSPKNIVVDNDEETASEPDESVPSSAPKRRMKLGHVGCKLENSAADSSIESRAIRSSPPGGNPIAAAASDDDDAVVITAEMPRRKLGLVGKITKSDDNKDELENDGRGRTTSNINAEELPRESSIERADRRRRELEEALKVKGSKPTKKKRKF